MFTRKPRPDLLKALNDLAHAGDPDLLAGAVLAMLPPDVTARWIEYSGGLVCAVAERNKRTIATFQANTRAGAVVGLVLKVHHRIPDHVSPAAAQ